MAKCPKCKKSLDWWKLLQFDKTQLITCQLCGSILSMDSQRATILIGGFVAILFLPETNLLPFDWGYLWFMAVLLIYTPFYISYMKLNVVNHGELAITPNQEEGYTVYAKGRRRMNIFGHILLLGGLLIFFAGMSVSSMHISEIISVLGITAMIIGLSILAITRCPFCNKITVRNPFDNGGRCINCHREIDVSD